MHANKTKTKTKKLLIYFYYLKLFSSSSVRVRIWEFFCCCYFWGVYSKWFKLKSYMAKHFYFEFVQNH